MSATAPSRRNRKDEKKTETTGDFVYTTEAGDVITLPKFNSVKPGLMRKIRKLDQADQFFTVLETVVANRRQAEIDEVRARLTKERVDSGDTDAEVTDEDVDDVLEPDETLDIIDDLDMDEFQDLQRKWFRFSGIDLGE